MMRHGTPQGPTDPQVDDIQVGVRVLKVELAGIEALIHWLDGSFAATVARLMAITGRVIVTGMGKSGHVARKIAATLASTGTPAMFVHPAEASHGDLGMLTPGDAVLALSNSGETTELSDLVVYTRRFGITLIAMTRRAGSTLAEAADIALVLPASEEACPNRLAPTTSTTMMLALGDALAVALLERRGFTADDFHTFHPGGRLGRKFLRVEDLMHSGTDLPLVPVGTFMRDALVSMTRWPFGSIGIMSKENRLTGIITDGDLRRHIDDDLLNRRVEDVMTHGPKTVSGRMLAEEALGLMNDKRITVLFVVDDDRTRGVVHVHDLLRAGVG